MTRQPYNHELRLERASEHMENLNAELQWWPKGDSYRFVVEADRNRGEYIVWVRLLREPSARLGVLIGDCLHNLRSALDNLIYDLVISYHGTPPPFEFVEHSEFPIFGPIPMKAKHLKKRIGGIDPRAQTIIKCLQPSLRGNNYASDPLWVLYELSNIDKHRLIHTPIVTGDNIAIDAPDSVIAIKGFEAGSSVKDGAEVARFSTKNFKLGQEVNVKVHLTLGITFPESTVARGWRIIGTLRWIRRHIDNSVLPPLTPYLTRMNIVHVSQLYSLLSSRG
jgi:hypothetical protein